MHKVDVSSWPDITVPEDAYLLFASDESTINHSTPAPDAALKCKALKVIGTRLDLGPARKVLAIQRNALDTGWLLLCVP